MAEREPFNFATWLEELAKGSTNRIASERMAEVVKACQETGRKGSVTIKIDISAANGLAEVRAALSVKKPEPSLPGSSYYVDKGGELRDEDPRQLTLPAAKILDIAPIKNIDGGKVS